MTNSNAHKSPDHSTEYGLRGRILKGSILAVVSFGGRDFLRLASNLILTRLLFPEAFGLMAIVQTIITGLNLFSDLGTQPAIVRSDRGDEPDFLNTAWTMQCTRGLGIGVVLWAVAPYIASFYGEPQLASLLPVAALAPILAGFNSTKIATAGRHLQFGRLTVIELSTQIISLTIMAILAWALQSVWALLIGSLVQTTLFLTASHLFLRGSRNRFHISRTALSELFNFGKYIFISTIAGFFLAFADRAILGKLVPLDIFALYIIGTLFASFPSALSDDLVRRIMLPLYKKRPPSESQGNRNKVGKVRWGISLLLVSAAGFLAITGDILVKFLYDVRYETAGAILVLVAIGSMPTIIFKSYTRLPVAAGHSGRFAFLQVVLASTQVFILVLMINAAGIAGATLAPGISALLTYPFLIWIVRQYRGLDFKHDAIMLTIAGVFAYCAILLNYEALIELWSFQ